MSVTVDDKAFQASVFGDGYVVARKRKLGGDLLHPVHHTRVIHHKFSTGAPYYIAYKIHPDNHDAYMKMFGSGRYEVEDYLLRSDGWVDSDYGRRETSTPLTGPNVKFSADGLKLQTYTFPFEEYDLVTVLSDGVNSFLEPDNSETTLRFHPVSPDRVLTQVLGFKGFGGPFVTRRCQWMYKHDFRKSGWHNVDDFSIGAIYHE